jgi:cell division protease FtsH
VVFLGHSVTQTTNISNDTARLIDEEIRALISNGEETARRVLHEKVDVLHAVAAALLEYETLNGEEVATIMRGDRINRPNDDGGSKGSLGSAVPIAGRQRPREEPGTGGMEPQPG